MSDILNVADSSLPGSDFVPPRPKLGRGRVSAERRQAFEAELAEWEEKYGDAQELPLSGGKNPSTTKLYLPDAKVSGPKNRASPKKNVDAIKKILLSMHLKIALMSGIEEIVIDEEEAQMLAESGAALAEYYKIKLNGKKGAMIGFIYAVSLVYGPRAFMIASKIRAQKIAEQDKKSVETVVS